MTTRRLQITIVVLIAGLFVLRLFHEITIAEVLSLFATIMLVIVTAWYVDITKNMADSTGAQVQEMKEQGIRASRPVILVEAIEKRETMDRAFPTFVFRNVGNGPALELDLLLLAEDKKSLFERERKPYLAAGESFAFIPSLGSHINSKCVVACQYQSVLAYGSDQKCYLTTLPVTVLRSPDTHIDHIYVQPGELQFDEIPKRVSY